MPATATCTSMTRPCRWRPTASGPGPAWADVAAYRKVQQRLGLTRTVVVQPTAYGTDNRATLAAIAALGTAVTRGVAVIGPEVTDAELQHLHAGGIRSACASRCCPAARCRGRRWSRSRRRWRRSAGTCNCRWTAGCWPSARRCCDACRPRWSSTTSASSSSRSACSMRAFARCCACSTAAGHG